MTADAKVGLLLGLVFIVIIAFLINGLPNLLKGDGTDDVIKSSVTKPNNNFNDLREQADEAVRKVGLNGDQRFKTTESFETEIAAPKPTGVMTIKPPTPPTQIITPPKPADNSTSTTAGASRTSAPRSGKKDWNRSSRIGMRFFRGTVARRIGRALFSGMNWRIFIRMQKLS